MKGEAIDREEIYAKPISDRGLVSTIYKELLKSNSKKKIQLRRGQNIGTDTLPKKIHRWKISI